LQEYLGEIAALLTAACWTVTAMAFESAGKRVGALSLNLIRLVMGLIFLGIYNAIVNNGFFPDATRYQWFWLVLSGLVGFVLGDLFLFRSFILIGARIAMLIMALVPPITALIGWITLGEVLTGMEFLGMGVTLLGIVLVMAVKVELKMGAFGKTLKAGPLVAGSLLALGGAVGQAAGLVLSKKGMQDMDAFSATQIRIMAGVIGFSLVISAFKRSESDEDYDPGIIYRTLFGRKLFPSGRSAHRYRYCRNPYGAYSGNDHSSCPSDEKRKDQSSGNYRSPDLCRWCRPVLPVRNYR